MTRGCHALAQRWGVYQRACRSGRATHPDRFSPSRRQTPTRVAIPTDMEFSSRSRLKRTFPPSAWNRRDQIMTVAELINLLGEFDPETRVRFEVVAGTDDRATGLREDDGDAVLTLARNAQPEADR